MKRLSSFIERLRGGRRPPTGPLTASEQTAANQAAAEEPPRESQEAGPEGAANEEGEKPTPQ
jgi:hypothetical protein